MSGTEQTTATLVALGNELLAEGRIEQASAAFIAAGYIDADAGRTTPAAPSGQNDYQWVCVESCTADEPHGERCDWQTPAATPTDLRGPLPSKP